MLLFAILTLSLLAIVNYRIGGRALLYPPVVFSAIFAFDLFLVWVAGDLFYAMLPQTLVVLVYGAFAFSLGAWLAMLQPTGRAPGTQVLPKSSDRMITILVAVVVASFPAYVYWIYQLVSARRGPAALSFLLLARMSMVELMGKSLAFTVFGTLSEIALIVALIAFYEREGHSKRALLAIAVSIAMGLLMGQKSGPLSLIVGLLCIDWIKTRRVRWKVLIAMALIFAALTATIEFYVHLGGDSLQEKAVPIVQNFAIYASGGIVAFDRLARQPNVAPPVNDFYPYYLRIVRKLGGHVEVPEVADFISIGPHGTAVNVYTIYWSFLELGYFGAIACVGVIGLLLTLIYKRAIQNSSLWVLLFAVLFRGVVFAPFNNQFGLWYFLFFVVLVWWLVYALPLHLARIKFLIASRVEANLAKAP
ncbi:MAG TPA: O-antigen polymerase [Candidatus Angelobacter sp.]|nr:O-antigen polymerase [Candidatus Angelobacter sp.]